MASQLSSKDFGQIEKVASELVIEKTQQSYADLAKWSPQELRQVFFAQLASLPGFQKKMSMTDQQLFELKQGIVQLDQEQAQIIWDFINEQRHHYFKTFIQALTQYTPAQTRRYIITIESMKAFVALKVAFMGAVMLGTGIVPYDSQVGQVLAPVATLASVIAVTRPLKILLELGRLEKETEQFNSHMKSLHQHQQLKIPSELLTAQFLLQSYQLLQTRACSFVLEN